ncbi:MAG: ribosome hibernation-promoting factor, HPF/YfiA family [Arachnia sp.]
MDIAVSGHHCSVGPDLKALVHDRIETVERLRDRIIRVEVDFSAREGAKDPSDAVDVQITLRSKGPVIRAEGHADDKTAAFEQAFERLKTQLRKAADRRKAHRGLRLSSVSTPPPLSQPEPVDGEESDTHEVAGLVVTGDGPLIVREKDFDATPLTLAQALDEMELVGHDFFLYQDSVSGRPSVVYRRKAYNYGVIHLNVGA